MKKRDLACVSALIAGTILFAGTRLADEVFIFGVFRELSGFFWAAFFLLTVITFVLKRKREAYTAFMLMLLAIGVVITSFPTASPLPEGEPSDRVRLYHHNTLYRNPVYDETAEMMAASAYDSDIVFLQEVRPELLNATEALTAERFPHRIINSDEHYPMALFSRFPIKKHRFVPYEHGGRSYLDAQLELPSGTILRFIGTHLASPGKAVHMDIRNHQLRELRMTLFADEESADMPAIMAGDLNATMYHSELRAFFKEKRMSGARSSYAWRGTWPAILPEPFRVTIDHAFGINGVNLEERHVGIPAGSDHLPVYHVFDVFPEKIKK